MTTRKVILNTALSIVEGERENSYGGPENSFDIIEDLWNAYLRHHHTGVLRAHDVACMMALLKIARLIACDGNHIDSWVDLAGYAACGGECGVKDDL
jgi:hypothetical protein